MNSKFYLNFEITYVSCKYCFFAHPCLSFNFFRQLLGRLLGSKKVRENCIGGNPYHLLRLKQNVYPAKKFKLWLLRFCGSVFNLSEYAISSTIYLSAIFCNILIQQIGKFSVYVPYCNIVSF